MIRGTLTLLMRSIRADAQQRLPHYFRLGSILFVLVLLIMAHASSLNVGSPGIVFFKYVAYLGIALITLAGMGHFANAITEEKEEGTLGLLLLADISPLSILLGKSTNRILSAWLIFLAQFPFALLAITLGGITVAQITATYINLAAYLFLIANLALLCSVLSRRTGEALGLMAVLSLLLHGFAPWLELAVSRLTRMNRLAEGGFMDLFSHELAAWHESTSVITAVGRSLNPDFSVWASWPQVAFSMLAGLALFYVAWLCFRRIVWAPDASVPPRGSVPTSSSRWQLLVSRCWTRALVWKDFNFVAGGWTWLLTKVVLIVLYVSTSYAFATFVQDTFDLPIHEFTRWSLLGLLCVELLIYASNIFHVERKWGTLPTLLMLPHTIGSIAYSKVFGCVLGSLPTIAILLAVILFDPGYANVSAVEVILSWNTLIFLCCLVVLCQLTVLCSLWVKWGALPLAFALMLILAAVLGPVVVSVMAVIASNYGQGEQLAQTGPVIYSTAIVSGGLQLAIGQRIAQIASD